MEGNTHTEEESDEEFENSVIFYNGHYLFTEPEFIVRNFKIFVMGKLIGNLKMTNRVDQVKYTLGIIHRFSSFNNEDFENLTWKLIWSLKELDNSYGDLLEMAFHNRDWFEFTDHQDEKSSFFNTPNNLMQLP